MASRYGVLASTLLVLSGLGCGQLANPDAGLSQKRWQEIGRRCRGEALLVNSKSHRDNSQGRSSNRRTSSITAQSIPSASIELARKFTVTIRARSTSSPSHPDQVLTAFRKSLHSSPGSFVEGTGVVVSKQGFILTNYHVVANSTQIEIDLPDVGVLAGRVIGTDPQSDLAVIAVDQPLPVACQLGDVNEVYVGQAVAAIGKAGESTRTDHPTSMVGRVTALQRSLQGALDPTQHCFYASMIESSIPLPQGYSGGPLVDVQGRVVGINTAAATDSRTSRRLGYAIRMTAYTRSIIDYLCSGKSIKHGYLGAVVRAANYERPRSAGGHRPGVVVEKIVDNSPAALAGIRAGDIMRQLNDVQITGAAQLAELVRESPVGKAATLTIERAGKVMVANVTLTQRVCK